MVFTNVFYQFLAVSKRRSEISVCFLDASFVDDFLFLELLVQCVSESLDGTLPHESVFHQCDKQSCYICFRSMGFQSCANSFNQYVMPFYQKFGQRACVGFAPCGLWLFFLQHICFFLVHVFIFFYCPFHKRVFLNGFLLLPEYLPVLFGSHAIGDAFSDNEFDHAGNKPFV